MITGRIQGLALVAVFLLLVPGAKPADIVVTTNIQAAIDAASPGDVLHLKAGKYPEILSINKSLSIVGSGTNCVIYSYQTNGVPLISIAGPATVILSNFELVGGQYQSWSDWYNGFSPLGIVATNASLTLNSVVINQIVNYFATIHGGSLFATNVAIWTVDIDMGCDVGFELDNCTAIIDGLTQDAGHIDHTININMDSTLCSDVTVINSRIRASRLTWGNCIRAYCNSKLLVTNCYLYRGNAPDEEFVPPALAQMHNGIGLNGYSNRVVIAGNTISNLPWAIFCYASFGGVQTLIESNSILNSTYGGIYLNDMSYSAVDMGGGAVGSPGGNVFSESPATRANYWADVLYTNSSTVLPAANLFALHNTWSNPTNKEAVIFDKLDNPKYGRLITDDLVVRPVGRDSGGRPVIAWNERGAGESYTVEMCGSLAAGGWTNAPGSWPVLNPGLNAMLWTNPTPVASNVFYRIRFSE